MKRFLLLMAIAFISTAAVAQKADVAFVAGGSFVSDTSGTLTVPEFPFFNPRFTTDTHLFLEGAFSARLLNAHAVALYVETPVAFIPSTQLSVQPSTGLFGAPIPIDHIRSLFVTPGLKVKLLPGASISPWASVGGGWARYSLEASDVAESKAALAFGGGIDFKTGLPLLGIRAEVRDFLTGSPDFGFPSSIFTVNGSFNHHNVLAGAGIVLRF
ncbi:MAG TPA: hypothetical protein VFR24_03945 [Candidatus Angelobacter sp.]|nr:hypothetical protein [Candidatus Angelobacter sp.]